MALRGLPREKVLATVVHLLETTLIRVGNDEYAKQNKSYGLTTLREPPRQGRRLGAALPLQGQERQDRGRCRSRTGASPRSSRPARTCPGQELFQYVDDDGERAGRDLGRRERLSPGDHRRATSPPRISAPGPGTVLAAHGAARNSRASTAPRRRKKNMRAAIERVAARLGNTPTICRKCYVHPEVADSYLDGSLCWRSRTEVEAELRDDLAGLQPEEAAVLAMLRTRLAQAVETPLSGASATPAPRRKQQRAALVELSA